MALGTSPGTPSRIGSGGQPGGSPGRAQPTARLRVTISNRPRTDAAEPQEEERRKDRFSSTGMGVRDLTRMCELRDVQFDTGLDEATGLWVSSADLPYVPADAPTESRSAAEMDAAADT